MKGKTIIKCSKCLTTFDYQNEAQGNLGYLTKLIDFSKDNFSKAVCLSCWNKENQKPFLGIDEIKKHEWFITWKGYQDQNGKSCGLPNCNNTHKLLDLSADGDAKLGGLVCSNHLTFYNFKLVGDWAKTWERDFDKY
jgi:predicted nucleic-acid-binding Zn-ribbon protein